MSLIFRWIWDDGISEAEEDLNKLLDEARRKIGKVSWVAIYQYATKTELDD